MFLHLDYHVPLILRDDPHKILNYTTHIFLKYEFIGNQKTSIIHGFGSAKV